MRAPRFDGCRHCGERRIASPVSELLPELLSPELRHLQVKLAAQLPYRQAAAREHFKPGAMPPSSEFPLPSDRTRKRESAVRASGGSLPIRWTTPDLPSPRFEILS